MFTALSQSKSYELQILLQNHQEVRLQPNN